MLHLIKPYAFIPFLVETGGTIDTAALQLLRCGAIRAFERSGRRTPGMVQPRDEGARFHRIYASTLNHVMTMVSIWVQSANARAINWRTSTSIRFEATGVRGPPVTLTRPNVVEASLNASMNMQMH